MAELGSKLKFEPTNEDTVQCLFFSSVLKSDLSSWEYKCKLINDSIETLSQDYIWHKDEFKVHVPIFDKREDFPFFLTSTTCFGDNIEDEWFILYLVMEITKQHKDLIVQIRDNDGDFLLIEAADYLPSWANPESTENRVFIHNNHIHLIPPEIVTLENLLTVKDAITYVQLSEKTQVSTVIEQTILSRIGNYPEKIKENTHCAVVKIPIDVATLLTLQPKLIAPIVNAYCSHDMIDARSCKNVKFEHYINHEVKFTKCLYAMLTHAKIINYVGHSLLAKNDKKSSLGLKLTCGLHMITNKSTSDIFSSKEYKTFISNLKGNGYFKDNIEGSHEYLKLVKRAKDFFSTFECPMSSQISNEISQLMGSEEFVKLKQSLRDKPLVSESNQVDVNDDWLSIHPEQLNEILNSRYGKQVKFKNDDVISPQTITSELTSFLNQTSDFEGIEPNKLIETDSSNIDFDSEQFANCVQKMLNLLCSENSEEDQDSELSDDDEVTPCDVIHELDEELSEKLQDDHKELQDTKSIFLNIVQSINEEKASAGPSSNLLTTVGFNKIDLLDSDDD